MSWTTLLRSCFNGGKHWTDGIPPTDFGFTAQRHEASFGLMDYNARYYSPVLGRFISPDPLVPEPTSSSGFNRYRYARNNPLTYTDPSGHCSKNIEGKYNSECEEISKALAQQYGYDENTLLENGNLDFRYSEGTQIDVGVDGELSIVAFLIPLSGQRIGRLSSLLKTPAGGCGVNISRSMAGALHQWDHQAVR